MTSRPSASIPGMASHYGRAARTQRQALLAGLPEALERLIDPLLQSSPRQLSIADIGCADGVNSFPVLAALRQKIEGTSIEHLTIVHLDLPGSDFNALIHNLHHHADSYLRAVGSKGPRLHPLLLPGSFYDAPFPPGGLDLVFSTTALHYASARAGPVRHHIDPLYASESERKAWEAQASRDCDRIMDGLALALRPGGKAWLVVPAVLRSTAGEVVNHWYRLAKRDLYEELRRQSEVGRLDKTALEEFVVPTNELSLAQWESWFAARSREWRLEFATVKELPNPYLADWLEHRDDQRFARQYLASIRAWSERIVDSLVLDAATREAVLTNLLRRFAANPTAYEHDNVSVYLGLTRL